MKDLATDKMLDLLKSASTARQQSIKLNGVQYAGGLAKELLGYAESFEEIYKKLQDALQNKAKEATLIQLLTEAKDKEDANEKAKAGFVVSRTWIL